MLLPRVCRSELHHLLGVLVTHKLFFILVMAPRGVVEPKAVEHLDMINSNPVHFKRFMGKMALFPYTQKKEAKMLQPGAISLLSYQIHLGGILKSFRGFQSFCKTSIA